MSSIAAVGIAVLLGSFPSGLVLTRLFTGRDVRAEGSGNIGAANVTRVAGKRVGVAVAVLDVMKGILAVGIGLALGAGVTTLALVAVAAVAGHDFSIFLKLRGGKGVATTIGAVLLLAPLATVFSSVAWLTVFIVSGYASLASIIALLALPLFVAATGRPPQYVIASIALLALAVAKHWPNIVRLTQGTETGFRKRRLADGA